MDGTKCAFLAAVLVAASASGVRAQGSDLQTELAHCLSVSGAAERLSCYDRVAREAVPRANSAANRTGPQEFGGEQLRGARASEEDRMTAGIADFRKDGQDRFTVALQNGQVWRQMAGDTGVAQFRSGRTQQVTISRGAMGSYDLRFNDRNATFKVQRLR